MKNLSVLIPPELEERLNEAKQKTGITKSALTKSALMEWLNHNGL